LAGETLKAGSVYENLLGVLVMVRKIREVLQGIEHPIIVFVNTQSRQTFHRN
jgi:hypothetical protein